MNVDALIPLVEVRLKFIGLGNGNSYQRSSRSPEARADYSHARRYEPRACGYGVAGFLF